MTTLESGRKNRVDFQFLGMRVTAANSALYGTIGLVILGAVAAYLFAGLTILDALIAGVLAMLLHWLSEIVHQYGHFLAARMVGHPMRGLRLWGVLGTSLYPENEGELPANVHIRRALGGPVMSFVILLIALLMWALFSGYSPMTRFLIGWVIAEHIFIFWGGALVPINLGFFTSDGGTIWHWTMKK